MVSTKILESVPDVEGVVEIRKLGSGSMAKLRDVSTSVETDPETGKQRAPRMLLGSYQRALVVYGIKDAPFFRDCKSDAERFEVFDRDEITAKASDYLSTEIERFNGFSKEAQDEVKALKKE